MGNQPSCFSWFFGTNSYRYGDDEYFERQRKYLQAQRDIFDDALKKDQKSTIPKVDRKPLKMGSISSESVD